MSGRSFWHLAQRGELGVYEHNGFWKSMDTSKDQSELEALCTGGRNPPWMEPPWRAETVREEVVTGV